ncbi:G patch domain and ankyrin repeat-containing protein 1 homolog [Palaemon carinicauda]|uniref:G patch domain and ankyrin repeat-containing protein 1 homolog n=1 Tax=Palaemon carinicauda TaxID=392227 RepID=UPI0035B68AFD
MDEGQNSNWKALATCNLKWKVFVQAKKEKHPLIREEFKTYNSSLTGEEAKDIYENIVQQHTKKKRTSTRKRPRVTRSTEASTSVTCDDNGSVTEPKVNFDIRSVHKAMKCAQNNEVAPLADMLKSGFDVNSKDEHGWSLLMVAACAGSLDAVKVLLEYRAKANIRDANGNTAIYLASVKGHKRIVELLINSRKGNDQVQEDERVVSDDIPMTEFFCDVCQMSIKESTHIQHETSIVHQFNVGSATNKTVYGISPSNKGYQLLVNQGWNTEKGLGLKSNGVKFPIKTVLKRNREGLGSSGEKHARVTHFGPGDESAVKGPKSSERIMRLKTISKIDRMKDKKKDIERERDIRRILNEPDF